VETPAGMLLWAPLLVESVAVAIPLKAKDTMETLAPMESTGPQPLPVPFLQGLSPSRVSGPQPPKTRERTELLVPVEEVEELEEASMFYPAVEISVRP
jgi:hypothetical protein